jgi:hypothetical protein
MCYAEIAAMVPVSGSAYSYTYAAFGELVAWIIGWDLMIEYAIGNVYVAQSWADYFQTFLQRHQHGRGAAGLADEGLPERDADRARRDGDARATRRARAMRAARRRRSTLGRTCRTSRCRASGALCNLPATAISDRADRAALHRRQGERARQRRHGRLKLLLIAVFLGIGVFHIDPANWHPFAPNGTHGIWQAAAMGFFSYIGFDAVSTAAEEARDPQQDVPRGLIWSLVICTVLYMATAAVLTGVVPVAKITSQDPLAEAFTVMGLEGGATAFALGAGDRDDRGAARVPARADAHLHGDGARRTAAEGVLERAPEATARRT